MALQVDYVLGATPQGSRETLPFLGAMPQGNRETLPFLGDMVATLEGLTRCCDMGHVEGALYGGDSVEDRKFAFGFDLRGNLAAKAQALRGKAQARARISAEAKVTARAGLTRAQQLQVKAKESKRQAQRAAHPLDKQRHKADAARKEAAAAVAAQNAVNWAKTAAVADTLAVANTVQADLANEAAVAVAKGDQKGLEAAAAGFNAAAASVKTIKVVRAKQKEMWAGATAAARVGQGRALAARLIADLHRARCAGRADVAAAIQAKLAGLKTAGQRDRKLTAEAGCRFARLQAGLTVSEAVQVVAKAPLSRREKVVAVAALRNPAMADLGFSVTSVVSFAEDAKETVEGAAREVNKALEEGKTLARKVVKKAQDVKEKVEGGMSAAKRRLLQERNEAARAAKAEGGMSAEKRRRLHDRNVARQQKKSAAQAERQAAAREVVDEGAGAEAAEGAKATKGPLPLIAAAAAALLLL